MKQMKKGLVFPLLPLAFTAAFMYGCANGQQSTSDKEDNDTVVASLPDTAFYGHLGESTGMSSLELITDGGDTLCLNKTNEKTGDLGRILGEIANYTDRYAITTCDDNQSVDVALNIDQLAHKGWQSDTDGQNGFRLDMDGKASPLSGQSYKYKQWSLYNCQLVLLQESKGTQGNEMRSDTLEILKLTPDSLILQDTHKALPERFHSIS